VRLAAGRADSVQCRQRAEALALTGKRPLVRYPDGRSANTQPASRSRARDSMSTTRGSAQPDSTSAGSSPAPRIDPHGSTFQGARLDAEHGPEAVPQSSGMTTSRPWDGRAHFGQPPSRLDVEYVKYGSERGATAHAVATSAEPLLVAVHSNQSLSPDGRASKSTSGSPA